MIALPACAAPPPEPSAAEKACVRLSEILHGNLDDIDEIQDYVASAGYIGEAMNGRVWSSFDKLADDLGKPIVPSEVSAERNVLVNRIRNVAWAGRQDTRAPVHDWGPGALEAPPFLPNAVDEMVDAAFELDEECEAIVGG